MKVMLFLTVVLTVLFVTSPDENQCRELVRAHLQAAVGDEVGHSKLGDIAAALSGLAVNQYTVEVNDYYVFTEIHLPGGKHVGYGFAGTVIFR